ncbi:MAG: HD domain-containing phosphohydrolase [Planctomycetaceae bacterium]
MTTVADISTPAADAAEPESTAEASQLIPLRPEDLIIGRELQFPVFDNENRLLLSEGCVITDRFKQLLRERKIKDILVHEADAAAVTLTGSISDVAGLDDTFTQQLAERLDRLIDGDSLFVGNTGPSVKNQLVYHGCKGYNKAQRQELLAQNKVSGASLDDMMHTALHGGSVDGSDVSQMAASYLTHMKSDVDSVMAIAAQAGQDADLAKHALNMSLLSMAIGIEVGLDETNVRTLGLCGLVSDWGMVKIPAELRQAERRLTPAEMQQIKKHPIIVLELLQHVSDIPKMVPIVCYQVHERPDGSGYPRGKTHHGIHPFARILHVADAYMALTSPRPFRPPLTPYAAMECLLKMSQSKIVDPQVVRSLLHVLALFPIGSFVALSDGSAARVLRSNRSQYTKPFVQKLQDAVGKPISSADDRGVIDLTESGLTIVQAIPSPGRDEILMSEDVLSHSRR